MIDIDSIKPTDATMEQFVKDIMAVVNHYQPFIFQPWYYCAHGEQTETPPQYTDSEGKPWTIGQGGVKGIKIVEKFTGYNDTNPKYTPTVLFMDDDTIDGDELNNSAWCMPSKQACIDQIESYIRAHKEMVKNGEV
jgi:hypothetical protein